ncbi:TIGR04222 domain-containing membrane protein [Actinokineospora globicatena]|uniref:TIGR04222 domain-containing membrane protein n=1 Tax=Actinokineospora globicatena TaxID=103729 RepID=UPI0025523FD5|nr:TIGR04222 domain-containing membrane protein [Actinokineospora globicatena]
MDTPPEISVRTWRSTRAGICDGGGGGRVDLLGNEELGLLAGGPKRAAEVAFVSLLDAGAVRVSWQGVVSAVAGEHPTRTALEDAVVRLTHQPVEALISAVATSPAATDLRTGLADRGYLKPLRTILAARALMVVAAVALLAVVTTAPTIWVSVAIAAAVAALPVLVGWSRRLTDTGRQQMAKLVGVAILSNRLAVVARLGLMGHVGDLRVWQALDLPLPASFAMRKNSEGGYSDGGCGGGCGGGD